MEPHYDDRFRSRYQSIPAAYYLHRVCGVKSPWADPNGNEYYTNLHNHAEMELLLFESGSGMNYVGKSNTGIPFEAGDLLIINPFEPHTGFYNKDTVEQMHLVVDFSVTLLEHPQATAAVQLSNDLLAQTIRADNRIIPTDPAYEQLRETLLAMYNRLSNGNGDTLGFLGELFRFFGVLKQYGHLHASEPTTTGENMAFTKQVLYYIENHFSEQISTRDAAAALRYSKEHFCRLFKANFQVSFIDYLTQYRIERAKRYLATESSLSVTEKCGFSSQSNFSRVFREATGISPKEYKKFIAGNE